MSSVVYVTAMGAECYECNDDGCRVCEKAITVRMGNANGPLMSDSIGDTPYLHMGGRVLTGDGCLDSSVAS